MDAVKLMGEIIKETAEMTKERDSLGCAKLVVLCNAPDDNPFMAVLSMAFQNRMPLSTWVSAVRCGEICPGTDSWQKL